MRFLISNKPNTNQQRKAENSAMVSSYNFMPHGHCYLWKPEILWLHVVSDTLIALAYFSIPITLTYIVHRSEGKIPFNRFFLLFAIFILACGTTHIFEIINVWQSKYILSGLIKAITAITSIGTAFSLVKILPKILKALSND